MEVPVSRLRLARAFVGKAGLTDAVVIALRRKNVAAEQTTGGSLLSVPQRYLIIRKHAKKLSCRGIEPLAPAIEWKADMLPLHQQPENLILKKVDFQFIQM